MHCGHSGTKGPLHGLSSGGVPFACRSAASERGGRPQGDRTIDYRSWTREHYANGKDADVRDAGEHKRLASRPCGFERLPQRLESV